MASWKGSQALADGLRPGFSDRGPLNSTPKPVVTPMAGFESACRPHPPGGHTPTSAAFRYVLMVSRRTCVACWMRRRDQPSCPRADICCFFSLFKTFAMRGRLHCLPPPSMSWTALCMAGFQVTLHGRFWVITEVPGPCFFDIGPRKGSPRASFDLGPNCNQRFS
jgi:hypothetical protein